MYVYINVYLKEKMLEFVQLFSSLSILIFYFLDFEKGVKYFFIFISCKFFLKYITYPGILIHHFPMCIHNTHMPFLNHWYTNDTSQNYFKGTTLIHKYIHIDFSSCNPFLIHVYISFNTCTSSPELAKKNLSNGKKKR